MSATAGLSEFLPSALNRGSTAAAIDLVFDPSDQYVDVLEQRGEELLLGVKPGVSLAVEELADTLVFRELEHLEVEDDRLVARFSSVLAAQKFALGLGGVRVGPFELSDPSGRPLALEARHEGTVDIIELHEVSKSDEWRLLHGRQLDVIPMADEEQRSTFADTGTVRVVDMKSRADTALFFNVRKSKLMDARVRRSIAAALDRSAIANVVCESGGCAVDAGILPDGELPAELDILVVRGESVMVLAAEVVQSQLREAGVRATVTPVDIDELIARAMRGDYELAISPLGQGPFRYQTFVSPAEGAGSYTGYANADYDAAVQGGEFEAAEEILAREVLFTPLYRLRSFAAIDSRWCGDVEPTSSSWRWLADLRPCEPGETP